jgi:hypothetical protein
MTRRHAHAWLKALGEDQPPGLFSLAGRQYRRLAVLKHDFFAATALYQGSDGSKAILKLGRTKEMLALPLDWLGRWLTGRERAAYAAIADLPAVPKLLGSVGQNGFVHAYVEGHPLQRHERVGDQFFDQLANVIDQLHRRDMAYIDLEKRENILVGDDGRPYLIDFQISLRLTGWWARRRVARWLLGAFQRGDTYHLLKHKRRHRPDLMTEQECAAVKRRSLALRIHRTVATPLTALRRRALRSLGQRDQPKQATQST